MKDAKSNTTEMDVGSVIAALKKYYEGIHTVQLECPEARVAMASGKSETLSEDFLKLKINLLTNEFHKKVVESKSTSKNQAEEILLSNSYRLEILRNVSGQIVLFGDELPSSKAGKDSRIAVEYSGFYQILPFGILSVGKKIIRVPEWLENNPTEVVRVTENECVLRSNGADGNLEVTLTKYNNSYYLTSLSCSLSEAQRLPGLYSELKYHVTDHKIINNFWLPTQFVAEKTVPGDGRVRYDPQQEKYVPLPASPYTIQSQIVFTDVQLNPFPKNKELTFETSIPDHTEVQLTSKRQIQHVWLNGKVVPLTDELALARARGHGFIPGVHEPRFWLMGIGLAMILFALAVKMSHRGKETKNESCIGRF